MTYDELRKLGDDAQPSLRAALLKNRFYMKLRMIQANINLGSFKVSELIAEAETIYNDTQKEMTS